MSNKELDRMLEQFFYSLFKGAGGFFRGIYFGIKKLKKIPFLLGFLLCCTVHICVAALGKKQFLELFDRPVFFHQLSYLAIKNVPLIYLFFVGYSSTFRFEKYRRVFEEIGMKGRNGRYPILIEENTDQFDRRTYIFKSNISLMEWKKKKDSLETLLDCSIQEMSNKGSKKVVKIIAIPSDYELSEFILWNDDFIELKDGEIVVGQGFSREIRFNLNRTPHVLAAGETGSGKSVILRCCLWQMAKKNAKIYMFDFKGGVEFGIRFENFGQVITERGKAVQVLEDIVNEMHLRLALFRKLEVKNLPEYNNKTGKNLCRIGVFCDEIAEMLDRKGISKEEKPIFDRIEGLVSSLARLSRATGINLFVGVQRPDANVLTGQIKNNIPIRICGRFADKPASEIVLNSTAATDLPDIKGRFLYKSGNELLEFQSYYFDDDTMLDLTIKNNPGGMLIDANEGEYENEKKAYEESKETTKDLVKSREEIEKEYGFNFSYDIEETIEWSVDDGLD